MSYGSDHLSGFCITRSQWDKIKDLQWKHDLSIFNKVLWFSSTTAFVFFSFSTISKKLLQQKNKWMVKLIVFVIFLQVFRVTHYHWWYYYRYERTKESIVRVIISIWGKVLKIGLSKFYRRQPSKNLLSPLLNTLSVFITAKWTDLGFFRFLFFLFLFVAIRKLKHSFVKSVILLTLDIWQLSPSGE